MGTSTSPKIAAANIPSITTLRTELNYGDPRLPRCAAFYDDTRAFRKKFVTSHGVAGSDLHDWKSRHGQAGLTEMTVAYLDKEGNGPMFWPDDKSSSKYNKYQYSKDHGRIKRLVKQLFFRLNQQQFRNKKYKHKDNSEKKPADTRGLSEQTAIDVDAIDRDEIITALGQSSGTVLVDEPSSHTNVSASAEQSDVDQGRRGQHASPDRLDVTDIYAVPPSPPRMRQFETVNPSQPPSVKRGPTFAHPVPRSRQPKRQRKLRSSIEDNEQSAKDFAGQPRTSPRTKRAVLREGYHGLDVMNDVIDSAEALDPGLETPSLAQQPSSPWSPVITVKPLVNNTATSIDGAACQGHNFLDDAEWSALLQPTPSPGQTPGNDNGRPGQDQGHPETVHAAPTPSRNINTGSLNILNRESEQPKPPLLHPSTSPTPGPAGGASGGAKLPIHFNYRVVLSRTPRTVTERWIPQGRFQEKTLAGLLKELPFGEGECQGLIFTVESSCMRTVERILSDDEDGFGSMKRYINMEIREWLARQRGLGSQAAPRLVVDIMIERMSDEKKQGVDRLEDLELEW